MLGFDRICGRPDYPSLVDSDGSVMLTLWQAKVDDLTPFDWASNIGLHHVALRVRDRAALDAAFERAEAHPGVAVDFPPEPFGGGPCEHAMVFNPRVIGSS